MSRGSSPSRRGRSIALGAGMVALAVAVTVPAANAASPKTKRVSVASNGAQGQGDSNQPKSSANGRFVVFESEADGLVSNDTNLVDDVFVHDRVAKRTRRVSVRSNGAQGNAGSEHGGISADGRFVVFESDASDLVNNDTNGSEDVFLHDRKTGKTRRVSVRSNGAQGNADSENPSISANGRFIVFESLASNLVNNDTNGFEDVFVHDRSTKTTRRVSLRSNGAQGNADSEDATISATGRFVAFESDASNLVNNDTNGSVEDIFVHDRSSGRTTLVSRRSNGGAQGDDDSDLPDISADGRFVVFESDATNLVNNDTNAATDIFVHDRRTRATKRVSVRSNGVAGAQDSNDAAISANGRWVVFESDGDDLVAGDSNLSEDIFLHDRKTKTTILISRRSNGPQGNGDSDVPDISADGRWAAFHSDADNLVNNDTNGDDDVFQRGPLR